MRLALRTDSAEDYRTFLKVKALPRYRIAGRVADVPDEYADRLGVADELAGHGRQLSLFDVA